jgi:glycerophosphoryl diester phosphodiesterase
LEAVLPVAVAASATLVIEAKSPRRAPGLIADMLRALDKASAREHAIITSFDRVWLLDVARTAPDLRLAELWLWPPPGAGFVGRTGIVSVFWSSVLLDPTLIARVRRAGRQLWPWTVDTPGLMRQLEKRGVDGLVTSRPVLCQQTLRRGHTPRPG